jgi:hypothetical protein
MVIATIASIQHNQTQRVMQRKEERGEEDMACSYIDRYQQIIELIHKFQIPATKPTRLNSSICRIDLS